MRNKQASPDASSAGLCPGLASNALISQFLLLISHHMRNLVIAEDWPAPQAELEAGGCDHAPVELRVSHEIWPSGQRVITVSMPGPEVGLSQSNVFWKWQGSPSTNASFQGSGGFSRDVHSQGPPPSEVLRVECSHFPLLAHAYSSSEQTGR